MVANALTADSAVKTTGPEHTWRPPAEGLYDLSREKDACGVGFIANIKGVKSHQIVCDALRILCNLEHHQLPRLQFRPADLAAHRRDRPGNDE
jgi:glutamate synthase (NADPH/NADH) large chain